MRWQIRRRAWCSLTSLALRSSTRPANFRWRLWRRRGVYIHLILVNIGALFAKNGLCNGFVLGILLFITVVFRSDLLLQCSLALPTCRPIITSSCWRLFTVSVDLLCRLLRRREQDFPQGARCCLDRLQPIYFGWRTLQYRFPPRWGG